MVLNSQSRVNIITVSNNELSTYIILSIDTKNMSNELAQLNVNIGIVLNS